MNFLKKIKIKNILPASLSDYLIQSILPVTVGVFLGLFFSELSSEYNKRESSKDILNMIAVELQKNKKDLQASLVHHEELFSLIQDNTDDIELNLRLFNPTGSAVNLSFNENFATSNNVETLLLLSEINDLHTQLIKHNDRGSNILLQMSWLPAADSNRFLKSTWQSYFLDLLSFERKLLQKYEEADLIFKR